MVKEYEIKTLLDFTQLPEEKLLICLGEFAEWIQIMRAAKLCEGILTPIEKFVWIDDKQRNITINITNKG